MPAILVEPGMPLWVDLATPDVASARAFYAALLGWEFRDVSPGYALATKDGMPVAGIAAVPSDNQAVWGIALYAPDVAQVHDDAVAAGATSVLAPTDLGERGEMAVVVDPAGATVGLKNTRDEHALLAAGEPGTPVWFELLAGSAWRDVCEFYHRLSGWDIRLHGQAESVDSGAGEDGTAGEAGASSADEGDASGSTSDTSAAGAGEGTATGGDYAVAELSGAAVAGVWNTSDMPGAPSLWTVYFGVRDVDAALTQAEEQGGQVVRTSWDSEFGRMATVQDPTGALVNLCEVEEYDPEVEDVHEPDLFAPEA